MPAQQGSNLLLPVQVGRLAGYTGGACGPPLSGSPGGLGTNTPAGLKQGVRLMPTWRALRHRGSGAAVDADMPAIGDEAVASAGPAGRCLLVVRLDTAEEPLGTLA